MENSAATSYFLSQIVNVQRNLQKIAKQYNLPIKFIVEFDENSDRYNELGMDKIKKEYLHRTEND